MKNSILVLLIFCFSVTSYAQAVTFLRSSYINLNGTSGQNKDLANNATGATGNLKESSRNIVGSPFYKDEWQLAKLTTKENDVYENVLLKLDLQYNEIYYKRDEEIVVLNEALFKKITFMEAKDSSVFISEVPPIGKQTFSTFYKQITVGKYNLVCLLEKTFSQTKNAYTYEITNEYANATVYYLMVNGTVQPINPKKNISSYILAEDAEKYKQLSDKKETKGLQNIIALLEGLNK